MALIGGASDGIADDAVEERGEASGPTWNVVVDSCESASAIVFASRAARTSRCICCDSRAAAIGVALELFGTGAFPNAICSVCSHDKIGCGWRSRAFGSPGGVNTEYVVDDDDVDDAACLVGAARFGVGIDSHDDTLARPGVVMLDEREGDDGTTSRWTGRAESANVQCSVGLNAGVGNAVAFVAIVATRCIDFAPDQYRIAAGEFSPLRKIDSTCAVDARC